MFQPHLNAKCLMRVTTFALAAMALNLARSRRTRSRLQTELERANGEIALLREELKIVLWMRYQIPKRLSMCVFPMGIFDGVLRTARVDR